MQLCLSQYLILLQRAQENDRIYFVNLSCRCCGMFLVSLVLFTDETSGCWMVASEMSVQCFKEGRVEGYLKDGISLRVGLRWHSSMWSYSKVVISGWQRNLLLCHPWVS